MNPQIHEWRKTVQREPGHEEILTVAGVFRACSDLWLGLIKYLSQKELYDKSTIRKFDSGHSYFCLWADGFGVSSGQFEEDLQRSQRAGDLTIRLLQNICRALIRIPRRIPILESEFIDITVKAAELALASEKLAVLVQGDDDSGFSDNDDSNGSSPDGESERDFLENIADDLRTDCQCLMDLGSRFEEQVTNPIAAEAAAKPAIATGWGPANHFAERVLRIYPGCAKNLAERLGGACWTRLRELDRSFHDDNNPAVADSLDGVSVDMKSTIHNVARETSLFRDSGLGTTSNLSESTPEPGQRLNDGRSEPRLPDGASQGKPFTCMLCGRTCVITKETAWRDHLISDIQPYVCPETGCDSTRFADQDEMAHHLKTVHQGSLMWVLSKCRICSEAVGTHKDAIIEHLADHMEHIALAILPRNITTEGVGKAIPHMPTTGASPKPVRDKATQKLTESDSRDSCDRCRLQRIRCVPVGPIVLERCRACWLSNAPCTGRDSKQPRLNVQSEQTGLNEQSPSILSLWSPMALTHADEAPNLVAFSPLSSLNQQQVHEDSSLPNEFEASLLSDLGMTESNAVLSDFDYDSFLGEGAEFSSVNRQDERHMEAGSSDKDKEDTSNSGSELYVFGLHPRLDKDEVTRIFQKFGEVAKCEIMKERNTQEPRGFGFVEMVTPDQAVAAIQGLHGYILEGRTLSVVRARWYQSPALIPSKYHRPPQRGPKKKEQQEMSLGAFLNEDDYGGSWADEVDDFVVSPDSTPIVGTHRTGSLSNASPRDHGSDRMIERNVFTPISSGRLSLDPAPGFTQKKNKDKEPGHSKGDTVSEQQHQSGISKASSSGRPEGKSCLNCSQRRIKCDRAWPSCTQCVRSQRKCTLIFEEATHEGLARRRGLPPGFTIHMSPGGGRVLEHRPEAAEPLLDQSEADDDDKRRTSTESPPLCFPHWQPPQHMRATEVESRWEGLPLMWPNVNEGGSVAFKPPTSDLGNQQQHSTPSKLSVPRDFPPQPPVRDNSADKRAKPFPPFPPIKMEAGIDDTIALKRARNTLAARKSRENKARRDQDLEDKIARLERERDKWKQLALQRDGKDKSPDESSSSNNNNNNNNNNFVTNFKKEPSVD